MLTNSPQTLELTTVARYGLLPNLIRDRIVDQALNQIECSTEETNVALEHFCEHHGLTNQVSQKAWLAHYGLQLQDLSWIATRPVRLQKFKQTAFGHQLRDYFLKRKRLLDCVAYSIIRVREQGVAQELYFRVREHEQPFDILAQNYSEGSEAAFGGRIGLTELGNVHPALAQVLEPMHTGQIRSPIQVGNAWVVLRLDNRIPVQFSEFVCKRLLNELFDRWLQNQINQLPLIEQSWFIAPQQRQPNPSGIVA